VDQVILQKNIHQGLKPTFIISHLRHD